MLKYKDYNRSEKVPFIVYTDFECYIKPVQSCDPDDKKSSTKQYQNHEPFSFCYYIKCFSDEVYKSKSVSYIGEDAAQKFVEMLEKDIREITSIPEKKMIFGEKEKEDLKRKLNVGYVTENSLEVMLKIIRLDTIAILPLGIEELHTTNGILSIENLILRLWCFITLVGMIASYS